MKQQTRRSFLAACTATGLAAAMPSVYVHASDKSGTRLPVLGSGAQTYECVHDWLIPPPGLVWGDTHGLCQDEQGNIYVGHTVHKSSMRGEAIVVFDGERSIHSRFRRRVSWRRTRTEIAPGRKKKSSFTTATSTAAGS